MRLARNGQNKNCRISMSLLRPTGSLFSANQYRNRTVENSLSPVFRLQPKANTPQPSRRLQLQCCSESSYQSKARPAPVCSSPVSSARSGQACDSESAESLDGVLHSQSRSSENASRNY